MELGQPSLPLALSFILLTHLKSPPFFRFECLPHRLYKVNHPYKPDGFLSEGICSSLRSRRLEPVGTKKKKRAREK